MVYPPLIMLVVFILRFAYVSCQNATIYGVIGEDISLISPLPTATFASQSGGSYIYTVAQSSTNFTMYHVPAQTETTTDHIPVYDYTYNVTRTTVQNSYITPPITTTVHGSASRIIVTTLPLTTTEAIPHVKSTSPEVTTRTHLFAPVVVPYGSPDYEFISVSTNGSLTEHLWYVVHDQSFSYNCDISRATCHYTRIFGGFPLDNVTYTGKVVPMWVVANTQTNEARHQQMHRWWDFTVLAPVTCLCLTLFYNVV